MHIWFLPTLKKPKELNFSIARNEDWKIIYTFGHNRLKQYDKMKSFGKYLRKAREDKELPLRKVAAALDIDTSILTRIIHGVNNARKFYFQIFNC